MQRLKNNPLYCKAEITSLVILRLIIRFLVKITPSSEMLLKDSQKELPYEGAKEMLLADNVDDREFLKQLLESMFPELPAPKKKK